MQAPQDANVPPSGRPNATYDRLVGLLDEGRAHYRFIDHGLEGQTEKVSAMCGHDVAAAAKCIVLIVKTGRKSTRFVLAVVPGNARVDTGKVKGIFGATYVGFAAQEVTERLAGSVTGTVLPFAFHEELVLLADPSLLAPEEIFFNAARLDRSVAMRPSDYLRLAKPRLEKIAVAS